VGTGAHHHFPVIIRFVLLFDSSIRGSGPRANELSTTGKDPIERTARENSCGVLILGVLFHTCTQKARRSRARRRPQRRAPAGAAADRAAALVNDHTPRGKVYAVSFYVIFVQSTVSRFALVVSALVIRWCSVHPDPHEICTL
jgi:hypothetical protein